MTPTRYPPGASGGPRLRPLSEIRAWWRHRAYVTRVTYLPLNQLWLDGLPGLADDDGYGGITYNRLLLTNIANQRREVV